MQSVDAGRPPHGRMLQQHGAVILQIRRQLDPQRILYLGRLQQRRQHRRGREVGHRELIADEIRAALPLLLIGAQALGSRDLPSGRRPFAHASLDEVSDYPERLVRVLRGLLDDRGGRAQEGRSA